jgi:hypothetical protein
MFGGMETITSLPRMAPRPRFERRLLVDHSISDVPFAWKWALGLVALGVAWRLVRYLLQFPIWGDEAFICVNLLDRDYLGLLKPLDYRQVAPVLFLWSELTAYHLLGGSELAIRLMPFLTGLGSLFLFWRLTRSILNPVAALLAVGIFAVSYYPVRHSCEVKPYAFDLFWSLALLVPAASWLAQPERWVWLVALLCLTLIALGASYPAVFVAGAVSLVLLPVLWQKRDWKAWTLFAIYNLVAALSFWIYYRLAGVEQFRSTGATENWYWSEWFPPTEPMALFKWLLAAHTGNMLAYPAGGSSGASTGTLILCLFGLWEFYRGRRWSMLLLCLAPFGLTLLAAALHRYPYGGSARVAQHLAPAICLMAGNGAAMLIYRLARSQTAQQRCLAGVSIVLALFAVVGMVRDWRKPYKTPADAQLRDIVRNIARQAKPNDQIVVMDSPEEVAAPFVWYLRRLEDRVAWNGKIDWDRFAGSPEDRGSKIEEPRTIVSGSAQPLTIVRGSGSSTPDSYSHAAIRHLWCLYLTRDLTRRDRIMTTLAPARRPLVLAGHEEWSLQLGQSYETLEHGEVFHWMCLPAEGRPNQ